MKGGVIRILLTVAGWLPVFAVADDWPQYRGLNRDGNWAESGLLDRFPESGPEVAWRQAVGFGWSSPVVAGGRVFVADAELKDPVAEERLLCFDERSGERLWAFSFRAPYPEWAFVPGQGGGPSATPIVEGDRIYRLGANGEAHCLEVATGAMVWERKLADEFEIWSMGCRASPLIDGERLILFVGAKPGATVMALDKRTGQTLWQAMDDKISNSSPMLIESADGRRHLIVWSTDAVFSLEPETGHLEWRQAMTTSNNDCVATPVRVGKRLLIGGLMMEDEMPAILWPKEWNAPMKRLLSNTSTALVGETVLYSPRMKGELVCLDTATGEEKWKADGLTESKTGASLHLTATGEGKAFLFSDEGVLIRARLSPEGYEELSRAKVIEPTSPFGGKMMAWTPPAYANGHGFFRNDREVVCVSLRAGP
ncbi:MAG: PQQ-like beta-propeller repeat protein [Verrucomicrobiae bacterium]|nr:PQQ-like beta-propeller repeat protein [Verrucomicrobiae bacterium]